MGRKRNPNRDKAFELYKISNGQLTPQEIAEKLGVKLQLLRNWKSLDRWDEHLGIETSKGARKGNKNAVGNTGGAKPRNQNARKLGIYSKYLPPQIFNIAEEIAGMSELDKLWNNIQILQANLLDAQNKLFVKSSTDHSKVLRKYKSKSGKVEDSTEKEFEIQLASDKQSKALITISKVMRDISKLVRDYEELLHKNWDLATEEQKTRIEVLKAKIPKEEESKEDKLDKYFEMLEKSFTDA